MCYSRQVIRISDNTRSLGERGVADQLRVVASSKEPLITDLSGREKSQIQLLAGRRKREVGRSRDINNFYGERGKKEKSP